MKFDKLKQQNETNIIKLNLTIFCIVYLQQIESKSNNEQFKIKVKRCLLEGNEGSTTYFHSLLAC